MKIKKWQNILKSYTFREALYLLMKSILKPGKKLSQRHYYLTKLIEADHLISVKDQYLVTRIFDNDHLLRKNDSDLDVYGQIFILNEYQPIIDIISKKNDIQNIKTIMDVGANIGMTTLYFDHIFESAEIFAIEPDRRNFEHLKANCSHIKKIDMRQYAIWSDKKMLVLNDHDFRDGRSWSLTFGEKEQRQNFKYEVQGIDLNTLINDLGIEQVDILKIDIEGAESHIFNDSQNVVKLLSKVRYLAVEVHDEFVPIHHVIKRLTQNGFNFEIHGETIFAYK